MSYNNNVSSVKETAIPHPVIWQNDNWAQVVRAINERFGAEILKYGGNNQGYILTAATQCYELNIALWIDWQAKKCRCGSTWKVLCTITGTSESDGKFTDDYEVAKAYFGPGYPTCDHYKHTRPFSFAVRQVDDDDRIERERLVYGITQEKAEQTPETDEDLVPF